MKRTAVLIGLALLAASVLTTGAVAQCVCCRGHAPGGRWGPGGWQGPARGPMYDPDSVTTLRGVVTSVEVMPAGRGRVGGLHLTLDVGGKPREIHAGPSWFIEREGTKLAKGDTVEVIGSLVSGESGDYLIAREIKKGETLLKLRDERGFPLWAGGPRR